MGGPSWCRMALRWYVALTLPLGVLAWGQEAARFGSGGTISGRAGSRARGLGTIGALAELRNMPWPSDADPRQRRQLEAWMRHAVRTGQPGADTFRGVLQVLDRHAWSSC
jgi:hypothetical protein